VREGISGNKSWIINKWEGSIGSENIWFFQNSRSGIFVCCKEAKEISIRNLEVPYLEEQPDDN